MLDGEDLLAFSESWQTDAPKGWQYVGAGFEPGPLLH